MTDPSIRLATDLTILGLAAVFAVAGLGWMVGKMNRAIDRDADTAGRDMPGHVRRAYDVSHDPAHWYTDGPGYRSVGSAEVYHDDRDDRDYTPAERSLLADIARHLGGSGGADVVQARPVARPAARRRYPIATVTAGRFAGCRVRVVGESRAYPGEWLVEVVDGPERGCRTVVDGGWVGR